MDAPNTHSREIGAEAKIKVMVGMIEELKIEPELFDEWSFSSPNDRIFRAIRQTQQEAAAVVLAEIHRSYVATIRGETLAIDLIGDCDSKTGTLKIDMDLALDMSVHDDDRKARALALWKEICALVKEDNES